jgi:hypothetical protein
MINPAATIQLTTIELVIGKPRGLAISTAFLDRPCSSGSAVAAGKLPCCALPWPATSLADAEDPTNETNATPSTTTVATQVIKILRME